jgi:hypothetical protein
MTVGAPSAEGIVSTIVTDTVASVCSFTPSTMTGEGRIEGDKLIIPAPDYTCDDGSEPHLLNGDLTPINEMLRNLTYHYHPETDTLSVGDTDVWHRSEAASPRPEPTSEPTSEPTAEASPTASHSPLPSPAPTTSTSVSTTHGIAIEATREI